MHDNLLPVSDLEKNEKKKLKNRDLEKGKEIWKKEKRNWRKDLKQKRKETNEQWFGDK